MVLHLPEADQKILDNKSSIVKELNRFTNNVLSDNDELRPYETDGLMYTSKNLLPLFYQKILERYLKF